MLWDEEGREGERIRGELQESSNGGQGEVKGKRIRAIGSEGQDEGKYGKEKMVCREFEENRLKPKRLSRGGNIQ